MNAVMKPSLPFLEIIIFLNVEFYGLFNQSKQLDIAWDVSYQDYFILLEHKTIYQFNLWGPCHLDSKISLGWNDIHQIVILNALGRDHDLWCWRSIRVTREIIFLLICYLFWDKVLWAGLRLSLGVRVSSKIVLLVNVEFLLIFGLQKIEVVLWRVHAILPRLGP